MRLLLVEDDRNLRGFLRKAFREEGYDVYEAESGDRAVERALAGEYHCVVLDVMLPGRDGFAVVEELRRRNVATPILLLTARDELESRVRGLEGGADDYLTKPFDLPELLARVSALIRRSHLRHQDTVLSVGDVSVDSLRRRVTKGGRRSTCRPASLRFSSSSLATPGARCPAPGSLRRSGTITSTPRQTSSMCTSTTCERKWRRALSE